jgi:hypothetical protein
MKSYILKNNKKKIISIITTFIIYGWLFWGNTTTLIGSEVSLYKYVLLSSPIYILTILFLVSLKINKFNLFNIYIYILIPIYLIFVDCINQNYHHKLSYDIYMIYIFVFMNISISVLAQKIDIGLFNNTIKLISKIFIITSFIVLIGDGVFSNSRFLNTNFTSFLIAQFIIVIICQKKINIFDYIVSIMGVIEMLAASGRASLIVLIIIIFIKKIRSFKQAILYFFISIILFIGLRNIYYNYLKVNEKMIYFSRPIGFIVGDKDVVLDQSSNERLQIFIEYKEEIVKEFPFSVIIGIGPKNFREYSHNILIDSIAFGGIFTFTVNILVLVRSIKLKKYNESLFYQILFFYLCMLFTGTFITNITYWGVVFLQQYKYYPKYKEMEAT